MSWAEARLAGPAWATIVSIASPHASTVDSALSAHKTHTGFDAARLRLPNIVVVIVLLEITAGAADSALFRGVWRDVLASEWQQGSTG
jgi:hypothetical protein